MYFYYVTHDTLRCPLKSINRTLFCIQPNERLIIKDVKGGDISSKPPNKLKVYIFIFLSPFPLYTQIPLRSFYSYIPKKTLKSQIKKITFTKSITDWQADKVLQDSLSYKQIWFAKC